MSGSAKKNGGKDQATASKVSQARKMNHLKDDVYREMLLLEMNRPGAEMGLALALLRAVAQSDGFRAQDGFGDWLTAVCPLGLRMIETSLADGSACSLDGPAGAAESSKRAPIKS